MQLGVPGCSNSELYADADTHPCIYRFSGAAICWPFNLQKKGPSKGPELTELMNIY
jgi:hypothetical protein